MLYEYTGKDIEILARDDPKSIVARIKPAARIVDIHLYDQKTSPLDPTGKNHAEQWERFFGEANAVFGYDLGRLSEIYFRLNQQFFHAIINYEVLVGYCWPVDRRLKQPRAVEQALGLEVSKRPLNDESEVAITLDGQPLEKLVGLANQEDAGRYSLSGPYLAGR